MIVGIGTDIILVEHIKRNLTGAAVNEAFFNASFTEKEREEAGRRSNPAFFYATRFAGKEAVYKCFGEIPGEIRLNEIEILPGQNGKPTVSLSGACHRHAECLGIKHLHLSLSYDGDYAIAYAAAEN